MKTESRFEAARKALLFWTLFIGLGAVYGASMMLLAPDGHILHMDEMLPYFQVLPFAEILFRDYVFSGIALLIVNGLTNLAAAYCLWKRRLSGIVLGGLFGITLMLWICIQFWIFPANVLSTSYFVFGLCQAMTAYAAWVFRKQEAFHVDMTEYPNIGNDPKQLVVYFSRMGYVKKQAYIVANENGARLFELKTTEPTQGTSGFWWCGRFGLCRMDMPLTDMPENLGGYEKVTVCTPVWVFAMASPVRAFCRAARGKIRAVDLVSVHHLKGAYPSVKREAEMLLGMPVGRYRSIACVIGETKEKRVTREGVSK